MNILPILLAGIAIGIAGCGARSQHPIPDLGYIEDYNVRDENRARDTGSLWEDSQTTSIYFLDKKARRVNDIITVRIVESSSASNSGTTSTSRSSNVNMGVDTFLGQEDTLFGASKAIGKATGAAFSPSVGASSNNSFSGAGAKQKSDTITATISARVVKVLSNGNLAVRGKRELVIDDEKQTIYISGIVRPEDVDAQNTIPSTLLADAQIMYTGSGSIATSQRKGWATQLVEYVWPF